MDPYAQICGSERLYPDFGPGPLSAAALSIRGAGLPFCASAIKAHFCLQTENYLGELEER
jgi:hypothetical protein